MSNIAEAIEFQPINRSQLDTAPEGYYRVNGSEKVGDFYDICIDATVNEVEQVLFAYVRQNTGGLPKGCEHSEIRADGKQLILCYGRANLARQPKLVLWQPPELDR